MLIITNGENRTAKIKYDVNFLKQKIALTG